MPRGAPDRETSGVAPFLTPPYSLHDAESLRASNAHLAKLIAGIEPPAGKKPIIMSIGEPQMSPPAFVPEIPPGPAVGN